MEELKKVLERERYLNYLACKTGHPYCLLEQLCNIGLIGDSYLKRYCAAHELEYLMNQVNTMQAVSIIASRYSYLERFMFTILTDYTYHVEGDFQPTKKEESYIIDFCKLFNLEAYYLYDLFSVGLINSVVLKRIITTRKCVKATCPDSINEIAQTYQFTPSYMMVLPDKYPHYLQKYNFNC